MSASQGALEEHPLLVASVKMATNEVKKLLRR
jgi:hypothetical protein